MLENIRKNLHFNGNDQMIQRGEADCGVMCRYRPCAVLMSAGPSYGKRLSADEQMSVTKARPFLEQHTPNKPHKRELSCL
jgi:hypothetical protein